MRSQLQEVGGSQGCPCCGLYPLPVRVPPQEGGTRSTCEHLWFLVLSVNGSPRTGFSRFAGSDGMLHRLVAGQEFSTSGKEGLVILDNIFLRVINCASSVV